MQESKEEMDRQVSQAKALFGFARELGRVRRENVIRLDRHPWFLLLSSVDATLPGVKKWTPDSRRPNVLLSVEQQDLPPCPNPPTGLKEFLGKDWDRPEWEADGKMLKRIRGEAQLEKMWSAWFEKRKSWLFAWDRCSRTMDLFQMLYQQIRAVDDGNLRYVAKAGSISFASDKDHQNARHPILTRLVNIRLQVIEEGRAVITVEADPAEPTRFESELLSGFQDDGFRLELCQEVREDVDRNNLHPFDTEPVRVVFQRLAAAISPESRWCDSPERLNFNERSHFAFYEEPVIWIEERVSGMAEAADRIVSRINAGEAIPKHLTDLISGVETPEGGEKPAEPAEIEDRLAAAGGEDSKILLTKPANREQLEVARQIETNDAVLVMGPPGTGKTHTIANLIGDFLAQGKTVLVSSQKEKALRILKDMLPEEMQDLCVSFTNDTDDVFSTVQALAERLSLIRPEELNRRIQSETQERSATFGSLKSARRELFKKICREFHPENVAGREWTPSEIGRWLNANEELANLIPEGSDVSAPFPLTASELTELYRSNGTVTPLMEADASAGLGTQPGVPTPEEEAHFVAERRDLGKFISDLPIRTEVLGGKSGRSRIRYTAGGITLEAQYVPGGAIASAAALLDRDRTVGMPDPWVAEARAAGAAGGALKTRWVKLSDAVSAAAGLAEKEIGQMDDLPVTLREGADRAALREALTYFRDNQITGEPGFLTRLTQKARLAAIAQSGVSGRTPSNEHEYEAVLLRLDLEAARETARKLWNDLVLKAGGPAFDSLGGDHPEEQIRLRYGPRLEKALGWWDTWAKPLLAALSELGISTELLTGGSGAGPAESCEALARNADILLRPAVSFDRASERLLELDSEKQRIESVLKPIANRGSKTAAKLLETFADNPAAYREAWEGVARLKNSEEAMRRRSELLARLGAVAPGWAAAITARTAGSCPEHAADAWNWRLLESWYGNYEKEDFTGLQREAEDFSVKLREETVKLAVDKAWLALAVRMQENRSLMQRLQGWAQVASRIGRGTGKNVEMLRAQARDQMAACSKAVPCWIMPAEKALSTFDGSWKFDVIIIDEASQSDIVTMPLLFLAKKAVIAGDDRQVSPAAVGVGDSAVTALSRQYIQGKIANWQIYQAQASLYDLAKTAYVPQMLREHFRCVPPIIGYSNRLSYNGRILPLRDSASTELLPPVIQCRVEGVREANDSNKAEAEAIVGRIKACLAEKEYGDKTFGVIVMRSGRTGAQIQLINDLLYKALGPEAIQKHRILCGLSPDFQGDERDVIFLSLVDSAEKDKPLRREGAGSDDAMKKRWNVAVSRAKNQVWAVYSFDPDTQLQEGDIRKTFFDYLKHPDGDPVFAVTRQTVSGFAAEVARSLEARGLTVYRDYPIGAFVLPLVVEGSGRKAVVECDGEALNPTPDTVISEMERQCILRRTGWHFVRIRGGEWYRDPAKAAVRLMNELSVRGVRVPGSGIQTQDAGKLLEQVQTKAVSFAAGLREDTAAVAARRAKRERIIAELRKLGAEVDNEVRKGSRS